MKSSDLKVREGTLPPLIYDGDGELLTLRHIHHPTRNGKAGAKLPAIIDYRVGEPPIGLGHLTSALLSGVALVFQPPLHGRLM
jgi:hypothetical protein